MGYLKTSIKGITWVGLLRVLTRGITFVKIAVIARILSPSQFGLYDIAVLVLALLEIFAETGINVFLVQENNIKKYIGTAWVLSIIRGVSISAFIIIGSWFIALFFKTQSAIPLLLLVSIVPFVRGFINPYIVRFQKDLLFHREFYFKSVIFIVDAIFSIAFVIILKSPEGIIIGLIVGAIAEALLSFIFVRPWPSLRFNKTHAYYILHKGKWVTFSGIFNYLYHNLDSIIVGRMLGIKSLGLYNMAYKISSLPISEVADVISRVTFPVYIKISGDRKRLRKAYIKTFLTVSIFAIPTGLLFILFPKEIIIILLGEKWIAAATALQILGAFGIIRSISGTTSAVFLSVHKQKYVAFVTFVSFLTLSIVIVPLVFAYGIIGAAVASSIGAIAALPIMAYFTRKVLFK